MDMTFFELCRKAYSEELAETDRMYERFPLAISANVILGGALWFLLDSSHIAELWTRVDVFLYYLLVLLCAGLAGGSVALLAVSVLPRTYKRISALNSLLDWRETYRVLLAVRKRAFLAVSALLSASAPALIAPRAARRPTSPLLGTWLPVLGGGAVKLRRSRTRSMGLCAQENQKRAHRQNPALLDRH